MQERAKSLVALQMGRTRLEVGGDLECFDLSKLSFLCVPNHLAVRNFTPRQDTEKRKAVTSHRTPNGPQFVADPSLVCGPIVTP
jgi:hypothetical protein